MILVVRGLWCCAFEIKYKEILKNFPHMPAYVGFFLKLITRHVNNIYSEGKLEHKSTSAKIAFILECQKEAMM